MDHIFSAAGTNAARQAPPSNRRANDPKVPDHLKKMCMDHCYCSMITYQERNNNKYLNKELGVIHRLAESYLSIIDAGIQLSYLKRLYCSQ
jgi:hypothetical protein